MINLIGNEIKKVFSKWAVKIILIITILLMVVAVILDKFVMEKITSVYEASLDGNIEWYKEELQNIDPVSNPMMYIDYKTTYEYLCLQKEYTGKEEWKYECIINNAEEYIHKINEAKYGQDASEEKLKVAEEDYQNFINMLENDDWRVYTKARLEYAKVFLEQSKRDLNEATIRDKKELEKNVAINEILVETLEIRLKKDIPYDNSYMDKAVNEYLTNMTALIANEDNDDLPMEDTKEQAMIAKYVLDTEKDLYNDDNAASLFKDYMTTTNDMFLSLIIIVVAGSIISDEFNKGTIKQLLTRPYNRTKIWFAKYLTSIIVTIISMIILSIAAILIFGTCYGFDGFFKYGVGVFDFNTGSAYSMNVFSYVGIIFISKLSYYIMLATIAMFVGTILNNTAMAVAVPLLGNVASGIVSALLQNFERFRFLKYFITPHWDLSIYNFGKSSGYSFIDFKFSVMVYLVYLMCLIGAAIFRFKKEDIKNI